jgi:thymidylate synthase (FAD)
MIIVKPSATLLSVTPNAAELIERAGRVCYKSEDKIGPGTAAKFMEMLKKREHYSVIEHASASILFVCDRGVSHEMVRHRLCSFSQESSRFCSYYQDKFGREISVVEPHFDDDPLKNELKKEVWADSMQEAEYRYMRLIEMGSSPQIARSVLPNSLKTEIVMTANFREWLHFFKMRTSKAAHPQMVEIALLAQEILKKECPEVFS